MEILITGASSGIGKEFAKKFAEKGFDLVIVARRRELLEELQKEIEEKYKVNCDYFVCDLTKDVDKLYNYCKEKNHEISVLVNNAGFGNYGEFIEGDVQKYMNMIELNNKALVKLTYLFVKEMKKTHFGHIINVGSVASFIPGPYMAVYYATKSFVLSFSLAIREELKDTGIKVSVLCPGPTASPFWEVANGQTTNLYNTALARSSVQAAQTGMNIFMKNKAYAIDGLSYKFGISIARHLPLTLSSKIIGIVQSKTKSKK